ncbi:MAG TPA: hypothetical protein VFU81_16085, partial [Thermomicrobiales bacterium]|nr:hypothetical protein [Thermomicrobiales bacterium]
MTIAPFDDDGGNSRRPDPRGAGLRGSRASQECCRIAPARTCYGEDVYVVPNRSFLADGGNRHG